MASGESHAAGAAAAGRLGCNARVTPLAPPRLSRCSAVQRNACTFKMQHHPPRMQHQMEAFLDDGGVMSLCLHLAKYPTLHAQLPARCGMQEWGLRGGA